MHISTSARGHVHMSAGVQRVPGAIVTGNCKSPDINPGNQTWSSVRALSSAPVERILMGLSMYVSKIGATGHTTGAHLSKPGKTKMRDVAGLQSQE